MTLADDAAASSGLWMVIMALSLVTLSLMMLRWRRQRRVPMPAPPRKQMEEYREKREAHRAGDELLIQLEEMARRISAQVDTRFAKLDRAIIDADERIARLEAVLAEAERLGLARSARAADASGTSVPEPADPAPLSSEPSDARHQSVYDLADAGKTPAEIAERLRLPLGEVELILNLRSFR